MTDPADTRKQTLLDLAKFCEGIIPHSIYGGEPVIEDAYELTKDLMLLAEKVDRVVESYGEYARSAAGMSKSEMDVFQNQLRDALQGNATYILEAAIEDRIEARNEPDPDRAYDEKRNGDWA